MSSYINADKMIETLEKAKQCNKEMCHVLLMDEDDMIAFIKKQLTADVEEVRHGKWIILKNGTPICSCCKQYKYEDLDADVWSDWDISYCPHCGAKMDLE